MDKSKRKRTADVAEKLGVGLLLGTLIQGVFIKELSLPIYVIGTIMLAIAAVLIVISIALSQEDSVMELMLMAAITALVVVLGSWWYFSQESKQKRG